METMLNPGGREISGVMDEEREAEGSGSVCRGG